MNISEGVKKKTREIDESHIRIFFGTKFLIFFAHFDSLCYLEEMKALKRPLPFRRDLVVGPEIKSKKVLIMYV